MSLPHTDGSSLRFGPFELDLALKQLRRDGAVVAIAPKPLHLLALLAHHANRVVSREEVLAAVWPAVRVSDATLASTLRDLRRVLDDDAHAPRFVQTARGMGFRFVAPVEIRRPRSPEADLAGSAPLVGRRALLERLEGALAAAAAGCGQLLLLEGEPGIGKTRTLAAVGVRARAYDAIVCQARFPEDGAGAAYRPWSLLLSALVAARPPEQLMDEIGPALPWLARLVPALAAGRSGAREPDPEDESTTLRLFDAVIGFLRRVARDTPLVLLLDDLHGADRSSLRLLEELADGIHDTRILVVGSYRACELDAEHPLPGTLAELSRAPGYARHRMQGLDLEAAQTLVRSASGKALDPERIAALHARSDGNPFYLLELARHLAESADAAADPGGVPPSLCELLRGRLQRLPQRCRDTLELAAAIGREFDLDLLRRASGLELGDLVDALTLARRAGLVEMGWSDVRRFRHVLVQEAIVAGLPEARRRRLHRRVGEAARTLASAGRPDRLATAARHLCQVAEEVGPAACDVALEAAGHAERELAFEEAGRLYALALAALDRSAPDERERRCPLLLALARSQLRAGELGPAIDTAKRCAGLARAIGRADLLAEAALLFADYVLADGSEPKAYLEEALASLGPEQEALRGRTLAALSVACWYEGQPERQLALAGEALAIARAGGEPADLVAGLLARRHALAAPQHLEERLRLLDEALAAADRHGSPALCCQVLCWRAGDLMESGDREAAERDVARVEEIARATRLRRYLDPPARWRALLAMMAGRFAEAETWIAASSRYRQAAAFPNAGSYAAIQHALLVRERDAAAPLAPLVRETSWLDTYRSRLPVVQATLALMELEAGRPGPARRALAALTADGCAALLHDPDQLCTATWLAEICARLGAREPARALLARLAPWRDRIAGVYAVTCRGAMGRYLGLLAATAGRARDAVSAFEAGIAENRAIGATLYEAWTQWEYACWLARRGETERAAGLTDAARAAAEQLGIGRLALAIDMARGAGMEAPHWADSGAPCAAPPLGGADWAIEPGAAGDAGVVAVPPGPSLPPSLEPGFVPAPGPSASSEPPSPGGGGGS